MRTQLLNKKKNSVLLVIQVVCIQSLNLIYHQRTSHVLLIFLILHMINILNLILKKKIILASRMLKKRLLINQNYNIHFTPHDANVKQVNYMSVRCNDCFTIKTNFYMTEHKQVHHVSLIFLLLNYSRVCVVLQPVLSESKTFFYSWCLDFWPDKMNTNHGYRLNYCFLRKECKQVHNTRQSSFFSVTAILRNSWLIN